MSRKTVDDLYDEHYGGQKVNPPSTSTLSTQEGGSHYKDLAIQPAEYIVKNAIPWMEGNVIKYITRHKSKNGAEDIRKIKHFCDMILEFEYGE